MARHVMDRLRGAARLAVFGLLLGLAAVEWCLRPENRRTVKGRARWLQSVCRRGLRVLGVSVVSEKTNVSAEMARGLGSGGMLVSNHLGYLDILVLGSKAPMVFVAKREVGGWPVFGLFARMGGTLFVDRSRRGDVARVGEEITATVAAGVWVVVFAEGTSGDGRCVLPFRPALLEPAVRHRWPVVPAALDYTVPSGRSAANEVCWWGDMELTPHLLNLVTLSKIQCRLVLGEVLSERERADRKTLAQLMHERVTALRMPPVEVRAGGIKADTVDDLKSVDVGGDQEVAETRSDTRKNATSMRSWTVVV